ncbi:lipid II:glycine glycyltransferase FemX [Rhodococcus sp. NPDC059234]|uniref:lipid II:glycine glycyltransferase FemX n=1 Tax=Rhodococcus sp. NPDC059234 TaxID=3346781 RepID=UPI003670A3D1
MRLQGHIPVYLFVDDLAVTAAQVRVPRIGSYWQIPGPGVTDVDNLLRVTDSLVALAAENDIFTIRIDPQIEEDGAAIRRLVDRGLRRTMSWTCDHTVLVDLTGSEDEVLRRFSTRARRWIKRAARDGVVVERVEATGENCRIKYELLNATADNRFAIMSLEATIRSYQQMQEAGTGQLFLARYKGNVVAGAFAIQVGEASLYLTGASVRKDPGSSEGNGLGAHGVGHAVQWEIMRWARENDCTWYDMYGSPSSRFAEDSAHPLYGVGQFKLSFNKQITDYIGCYDVPVRRGRAWIVYQAERLMINANRSKLVSRITGHNIQENPDLAWFR